MSNKYLYILPVFIFLNFQVLETNAEFRNLYYCQQKLDAKPYIFETSDGKLIYIKLPDNISELKVDNIVYNHSGLYSSDTGSEPVWTIKEYLDELAISNDGTYLVSYLHATESDRFPRSNETGNSNGGGGLKFYKSGKLIKSYGVRELVDNLGKIPVASDIFHFTWKNKYKFDPENNLLFFETIDYNLYVFDITTGEIIGAQSNRRNYGATIVKSNGEQLDFEQLHTCYANSIDKEYSITSFVIEPKNSDKPGQQVTELTIPFDKIARWEKISQQDSQASNVLLHLHNGDNIQMGDEVNQLCGRPSGTSYRKMHLLMSDIKTITDLREIEIDERKSDAYRDISTELLGYYHKEDNRVSNWNKMPNENYQFVVSVDDYCEEILDRENLPPHVSFTLRKWRPTSSGHECKSRLAGYGKRTKAICYDLVKEGWRGPLMVVVPAGGSFQSPFAIAKYEISVDDWSKYCSLSGHCEPNTDKDQKDQPMLGISLKEAKNYATWLSERTDKTYRLPTSSEWEYAARAKGNQAMKKDFNCRVIPDNKTTRGNGPVSVKEGDNNDWGLKNFIGNVQEWVMDGNKVTARGGAFTDPYSDCDISLSRPHSGDADDMTGFRLVLEEVL